MAKKKRESVETRTHRILIERNVQSGMSFAEAAERAGRDLGEVVEWQKKNA